MSIVFFVAGALSIIAGVWVCISTAVSVRPYAFWLDMSYIFIAAPLLLGAGVLSAVAGFAWMGVN